MTKLAAFRTLGAFVVFLLTACSSNVPNTQDANSYKAKLDLQSTGFAKDGYRTYNWSTTNSLFGAYSIEAPAGFKVERGGYGFDVDPPDEHLAKMHIEFLANNDKPRELSRMLKNISGGLTNVKISDQVEERKGVQYTFEKGTYTNDPQVGFAFPVEWNKGFVMISKPPAVVAEVSTNWPCPPELLNEYEKITLSARSIQKPTE